MMNADIKDAFTRIKPVCDLVMVCPSAENIASLTNKVAEMKLETVQELQQYIMFPFITHIKSVENEKKFELLSKMADAMKQVLEKVTVNRFEMCIKIETALLSLVFDNSKPGMVAEVPEELKLSVMQCLTTLLLRLDKLSRISMLKTQVPTIAQAVFVSVHIAKLEKLRILRLSAIECLTAHTCTHAKLTNEQCHLDDEVLEKLVVSTLSNILPGMLAALQDVATDVNNPGHAVVMAALNATHRIICMTMNDKHKPREPELTADDFAKLVFEKTRDLDRNAEKRQKLVSPRSSEWWRMAASKLVVVTRSLASLTAHPHPLVRRELAVLCNRLLMQCSQTMQPSLPIALDVLISLSKDEYPQVAQYCQVAVAVYMSRAKDRSKTVDGLVDNFFSILNSLPRILNNVESSRKLGALNLLHGYIHIMCDSGKPQRLTSALSGIGHMHSCCSALLEAASLHPLTSLAHHTDRDVSSPPPTDTPWCRLRHLDSAECETRFKGILWLLGNAECAELIADRLLELFYQQPTPEIVYTINWMIAADKSPLNLVRRVLNTYTEDNVWYLPLEVRSSEIPVTDDETIDISVYNPRAWTKDSVPDLYEGTTETRITNISYRHPRTAPQRDPNTCATLADAHRNMLLSCLLTHGVGICARRLGDEYQPFLLKTLCLILERVGSKYEMLHLAGLRAINDIATACGHSSVGELVRHNADYFTHQVTVRLRKAWNSQSALQILSVVMEYSDASILNCLYGIVEDVLVQSCDKYYEKNLYSYLQVFLTFIQCINKWFPRVQTEKQTDSSNTEEDVFKNVFEFVKNKEESERLMDSEEFEKETGKSVEEMYREDVQRKEEDILDYDDRVTEEKPPLPQHIRVTETILKRCINFITSSRRDECLLSLQVLSSGFPILGDVEDELLPLVHQCWAPLVARFEEQQPVVVRRALDLLLVMADLSKDFIRSRTVKEVLPAMYKFLRQSACESYLKDAGSAYRNSHAYTLQVAAMTALPRLVVELRLEDDLLGEPLGAATPYLSNKQPKPLQALAVQFFKTLLDHDYGATWQHLRKLCNNDVIIQPPKTALDLQPIVGTPYDTNDKEIQNNVKLIWDLE